MSQGTPCSQLEELCMSPPVAPAPDSASRVLHCLAFMVGVSSFGIKPDTLEAWLFGCRLALLLLICPVEPTLLGAPWEAEQSHVCGEPSICSPTVLGARWTVGVSGSPQTCPTEKSGRVPGPPEGRGCALLLWKLHAGLGALVRVKTTL